LRAVDDIHIEVQVDGRAAQLVQGGGDRGRVGGHAADLADGQGIALGRIEVPGVSEHDGVVGHRPQPKRVAEELGCPAGQHGQRHAAEVAADRGGRGVEVTVRVQPHHGRVAMAALQPGYRSQGSGAVAG
jgi:hypothetical protein